MNNPYQAPAADLSKVPTGETAQLTVQQVLFSFAGRIGRGTFWTYLLALSFGFGLLSVGLTAIDPTVGALATLLLYIPMLWISFAIQAKRWHDRDKSALWILLGFVPLLNLWVFIECGFLRGTQGPNQFGPPPA